MPNQTRPTETLDQIVCDLDDHGFAVVSDFVSGAVCTALAAEIKAMAAAGTMRPAAIGKGVHRQVMKDVRGDLIHWLDEGDLTPPVAAAWERLMELKGAVNRQLFLGLKGFEAHLTFYPPGGVYQRHVDNFKGASSRRLSIVLYLNEEWTVKDGGQLRLYDPKEQELLAEIEPRAGTLAAFLSEGTPHEVAPAHRDRLSLTGWFLRP